MTNEIIDTDTKIIDQRTGDLYPLQPAIQQQSNGRYIWIVCQDGFDTYEAAEQHYMQSMSSLGRYESILNPDDQNAAIDKVAQLPIQKILKRILIKE